MTYNAEPSDSYLYCLYRKLPSHGAPIAVWTPVDITNSPNMALAFLAAENPYSSYPREAAPRKVVRSDGATMVISDDADERTLAAKETMRELTYLDPTTVQAVKRTTNTLRYGMARDGYTLASGAPMPYMLRIRNRWYRLMIWQFSNAGSLFVRILGKPHHVNEAEIDELWEAMHP